MALTFLPFNFTASKDYAAFVALWNVVRLEVPLDVARLRQQEAHSEDMSEGMRARWLVYDAGQMVGALNVQQIVTAEERRLFHLDILLMPSHTMARAQIYSFALEQLTTHQPYTLIVHLRENWLEQQNFYQTQGFQEHERMWKFYLNPQELDFSQLPYDVPAEVSLLSLQAWLEYTPENIVQTAFYHAVSAIRQSVPSADPVAPESFDQWLKKHWQAPTLWREGTQVALLAADNLAETTMLGLSELHSTAWEKCYKTGLTGVRTVWQRQGIARALKIRALQRAQYYGVKQIFTINHAVNLPMLELNASLGFIKEVGWLFLRKDYPLV